MTLHELGGVLLGAILLVSFGLLLGAAWATQALQSRFQRLAEGRRRLNEERLALRLAHRRRSGCPICGSPRHWHGAPPVVQDQPDDD